jgi:hypothetical protein
VGTKHGSGKMKDDSEKEKRKNQVKRKGVKVR